MTLPFLGSQDLLPLATFTPPIAGGPTTGSTTPGAIGGAAAAGAPGTQADPGAAAVISPNPVTNAWATVFGWFGIDPGVAAGMAGSMPGGQTDPAVVGGTALGKAIGSASSKLATYAVDAVLFAVLLVGLIEFARPGAGTQIVQTTAKALKDTS